ncbi:MAG TPA: hypothetical protein VL371_17830, partial [Gemmataceae bacterium]|nr:hypothetical protein [Gemmataceae bacterium]
KRAPVTYRLESGPPGAIVSPTGRLEWNVPASYSNAEASFVVAATNAAGRSTSQGFTVNVVRPSLPVAAGGAGDTGVTSATTAPATAVAAQADPHGFEVALPGPATDMALAGGGKYMAIVCKSARKLVVFDAEGAKVVRELPLPPETVLCAGTAEHLFIVLPNQKVIQRWRLVDWERDLVAPLPLSEAPLDLAAGACGAGPLLIRTAAGPHFFDPRTLRDLKPQIRVKGQHMFGAERFHVRAAPDGETFFGWQPMVSPSGIYCIRVHGSIADVEYEHADSGYVSPSDDGVQVFTAYGIHGADLRRVQDDRFGWDRLHGVAAAGTPFFFGVDCARLREHHEASVALFLAQDRSRVADLPALEHMSLTWAEAGGNFMDESLSLDKRFHARLRADSNVGRVIVIPETGDRLRVLPFDPAATMAAAGQHFLFFATTVAEAAKRGQPYSFFLDARSDRTPVRFRLMTGPSGLTISDDGEIRWAAAAADPYSSAASVVVAARDAGGKELRRTFRIVVH